MPELVAEFVRSFQVKVNKGAREDANRLTQLRRELDTVDRAMPAASRLSRTECTAPR